MLWIKNATTYFRIIVDACVYVVHVFWDRHDGWLLTSSINDDDDGVDDGTALLPCTIARNQPPPSSPPRNIFKYNAIS